MGVEVKYSGPLFDGTIEDVLDDFREAAERDVALVGKQLVKKQLHSVLKHPTGHYESQIEVERVQDDFMITDGNVIYGAWLEGVGSRNKATRFKGYATFRKVKQVLEGNAGEIAEETLQKYIGRMS